MLEKDLVGAFLQPRCYIGLSSYVKSVSRCHVFDFKLAAGACKARKQIRSSCLMDDVLNVLIFLSYIAISSSILYVFVSVNRLKRSSVQVYGVSLLWYLFVFTCGITHITAVVGEAHMHVWSLLVCTVFSLSAAVLTVLGIRTFNCFLTSQVGTSLHACIGGKYGSKRQCL
jgi:hypothetical protein